MGTYAGTPGSAAAPTNPSGAGVSQPGIQYRCLDVSSNQAFIIDLRFSASYTHLMLHSGCSALPKML